MLNDDDFHSALPSPASKAALAMPFRQDMTGASTSSALSHLTPASAIPAPLDGHTLPTFPIEVQKKILHFALYIPSSHPAAPGDDSGSDAACQLLCGQSGRQAGVRRVVERLGNQRAALDLMLVCKLWKREAAPYLYAEPHLTAYNLRSFAHALIHGDKKWSDINLHPYSTPGRYVTTLDLTHLRDGYDSIHPTSLARILAEIFPLIPNLAHLVLSSAVSVSTFESIRRSPFARRLKSLQGLQVDYELRHFDPVYRLLSGLPNLELLSLLGPGDIDAPSQFQLAEHRSELDDYEKPPLVLDKVHTLIMSGVKAGSLLSSLVEADLPAVRRLLLTSYHNCLEDLTYTLQSVHGHKITSLAYMPAREWPGFAALPPHDTLELHPDLRHLSYLLPKDLEHLATILEGSERHPLSSLVLPKWTVVASDRAESENPTRNGAKALMNLVCKGESGIKRVMIDGFRWVRVDLGMRALQTGDSGEMRAWAEKLRVKAVELVDMDGESAPFRATTANEAARGRRRSSVQFEMRNSRRDAMDEDGA